MSLASHKNGLRKMFKRGGLGPWVLPFGGEIATTVPSLKKEDPMQDFIPPKPPKSFRIVLELTRSEKRLDAVLLAAIKAQNEDLTLREISRTKYKELFNEGKIQIKGQRATPSSAVAKGTTYVDILGYKNSK